jgi:hypothetical protein
MTYWSLDVDRTDLAQAELRQEPPPTLADGEALLRVDRVGLTANNVTYALLGEAMRYWDFFPAGPGRGRVPLWGFAEVTESTMADVEPGTRVYGYLPPASHLVVRPDRVDGRGFHDASEHRASLPSPYNSYAATTGDPAYDADAEDLLILFRPLYFTSFMLADQVLDNDSYGAATVVLTSASSRTSYGTAFQLRGRGPRVVGLTSPANVSFTAGLECYDDVLPYDDVSTLDGDTVLLDVAGNAAVRDAVRGHLGPSLVRDITVGIAHQNNSFGAPGSEVFFAPNQMRKRGGDWGRDGLNERFAAAWREFLPLARAQTEVVESHGPDGLRAAWLEVLAGRTPPRSGHVVAL